MSKTAFKNLYSLPVDEFLNIEFEQTESFIFQGSKNWDMYFSKKLNDIEISEFSNVLLVDFQNKEEFETYLKNNSKNIIDYSIEHILEKDINKYFVLVNNNG